jgi:hypothetical protein
MSNPISSDVITLRSELGDVFDMTVGPVPRPSTKS